MRLITTIQKKVLGEISILPLLELKDKSSYWLLSHPCSQLMITTVLYGQSMAYRRRLLPVRRHGMSSVLIPQHATTTSLFVLNRNPTLDRLANWNADTLTTCLLCGVANESREHLFLMSFHKSPPFCLPFGLVAYCELTT